MRNSLKILMITISKADNQARNQGRLNPKILETGSVLAINKHRVTLKSEVKRETVGRRGKAADKSR